MDKTEGRVHDSLKARKEEKKKDRNGHKQEGMEGEREGGKEGSKKYEDGGIDVRERISTKEGITKKKNIYRKRTCGMEELLTENIGRENEKVGEISARW